SGKSDEVQSIIENIGQGEDITTLRILAKDGRILKSKNPKEIGARSRDFVSFGFENLTRPFFVNGQVYNYRMIKNQKACYGCHSSTEKINGIIELKIDTSKYTATVTSLKRFLLIVNILAVVVIAGVLSLMLSSFVLKPIGGLLTTMRKVERGNWDAKASIQSGDELGNLALSFNNMVSKLKDLHEKTVQKERELSKVKTDLEHKQQLELLNSQLEYKVKEVETANKAILVLSKEIKSKNKQLTNMVERLKRINEIGRMLNSIVESEELVKLIVKTTAELLNVQKGAIHINDERQNKLTLHYQRGKGIRSYNDITIEFKNMYVDLLNKGRPILIRENGGKEIQAMAVPLKMRGKVVGAIYVEQKNDGGSFSDEELEILSTLSNQVMAAIENAWLYEKLKTNYFSTIQALVNALEANDRYTKGHSERVRILATELGRHIGLDYKEIEVLEHAAILHDIGKIGIDSNILKKDGELTHTEYSLIKAHPLIGEEILGPVDTLEAVRTTIIQHHERYDGKGYPYGLAGEEISLKARILAVVDTFDAMLTDRPYRKALPFPKVISELRTGAGTQFDPFVVESFIDMINKRGDAFLHEVGYSLTLTYEN
ncbi:MAG: HD domain-containing protein, partial [Nitrospirae bacterium]